MIMVPIVVSDEPSSCPKCNNVENIKKVCKHCGYEYKEKEDDNWNWSEFLICSLIVSGIIVFIIITFYVIGDWVNGSPSWFDGEYEEKITLWESIEHYRGAVFDFFKDLLSRII